MFVLTKNLVTLIKIRKISKALNSTNMVEIHKNFLQLVQIQNSGRQLIFQETRGLLVSRSSFQITLMVAKISDQSALLSIPLTAQLLFSKKMQLILCDLQSTVAVTRKQLPYRTQSASIMGIWMALRIVEKELMS